MKTLQQSLLFILIILSAISAGLPLSVGAATTLAAPTIADPTLSPGATPFTVNITVANVQQLFGYQFTLDFNATVLTAQSAGSYPPFNTIAFPTSINNTAGFVSLAYYTYLGDRTGFTGSTPVAWIKFTPVKYGTSKLHLHGPQDGSLFSDVNGNLIQHIDIGGIFTNLINIAVTNVTATPKSVNKTQTVNINVAVQNQGGIPETFNVTTYYGSTPIQTKTANNLGSDTSTTIQFTWDTTYVTPNTYTIKAQAQILPGESNTADNTFIDGKITVIRPAGNPTANFTYSPNQPLEGQTVTFNASLSTPNSGTITSYAWDFGDYTKLIYTSANLTSIATHTYSKMGTYPVTLNVTNSQSKWDGTQTTVTIYRHDVAIINITSNKTQATSGETVQIDVTVTNKGNLNETFPLTLKINDTQIQTKTVTNLTPKETRTITFNWNTTGTKAGIYVPSANATVEKDASPNDTVRAGNTITIKDVMEPAFNALPVLEATPIAVTIILTIAAWHYLRKRRH